MTRYRFCPTIMALCVFCISAITAVAGVPTGWTVAGGSPQDYEFSQDSNTASSGHYSAVVILLDTLVSVGTERANTLDVAVRAAASLAAHYLYRKDRVGLINYGGVCTWVPPAVGQFQLYRLLDALLETRTHFSYLTKDIALIPPRVMPPGALVFVLTTLLDARLETALHDLLARAFQLVLLVLSPVYVMPMSRQPRQAEATARLWRLEMDLRLHQFRRLGIPVVVQESADPLRGLYSLSLRERH